MVVINSIALIMILSFYLVYGLYISTGYIGEYGSKQLLGHKYKIRTIFLSCFLLKIITSAIYFGFETDMSCFYSWSVDVAEHGFSNFYNQGFADYPPGYIYVLKLLGIILNLFHVPYGSVMTPIILKTPAILCDVLTGFFLYKVARKRFKESTALIFALVYMFNPAIYINSSVWGQIDSVHTLFVIYMLYCLVEEKYPRAIMSFAIGILIKPQTIFFFPVLGFVCFKGAFLLNVDGKYKIKFNSSKFRTILIWALLGIGSIFLFMCPFGIGNVFNQYMNTISSYNVASGFIYFKSKMKEDTKIYLCSAFLVITIFMFSVRMHERYMFPGIVLLLLVYLTKPNKKMFLVFGLFSVVQFYNASHVLFYYDWNNYDWEAPIPKLISAFSLLIYALFIYVIYLYNKEDKDSDLTENLLIEGKDREKTNMKSNKREEMISGTKPLLRQKEVKGIFKSQEKMKFTKRDWLIILSITVVYALIAFYNLGYNYAPETEYRVETQDTTMEFQFPEGTKLSKISVYNGYYENREFQISCYDTKQQKWVSVAGTDTEYKYPVFTSVFKWNSISLTTVCDPAEQEAFITGPDKDAIETDKTTGDMNLVKLISKSAQDPNVLLEMVFLDADGNQILPLNSNEYPELFDEQEMYDPSESYRSGTYFDEIYHARTAYEFLHGLPTYEWTHPPLGKILIAVGVSIFGMNPFGWRVVGTLFGVLMLPFIFLFARRLFKKTWAAGVTCLLFAVDFMHFAQTRIATIDVYITFFIILMYYFMYQYITTSYYDKKLYKCLIPLGLCGISTGLGIASKVTGAYAAAGLAVIFFWDLYKRYKEYRYACLDPDGSTNGISHADVQNKFKKNTLITILFCIVAFIIIPFVIYTLSYIPFIDKYTNENLGLIERMLINQKRMFDYHAYLDATHPFSSTWYQWPIIFRPIYYFSNDVSATMAEGISSFGNPLVWWGGIVAFIGTIYYSIREKDRKGVFLIIGYLAQYLPWVMVSRCTFIYHYFPSVPFLVLMIVFCMYHLLEKHPKIKPAIIAFVVLAVVLFFMFYPVLSGMTVDKWYVNHFLRWSPQWVLMPR